MEALLRYPVEGRFRVVRRKMRKAGEGRVHTATAGGLGPEGSLAKQLGKSDPPHLEPGSLEELTSCLKVMIFECGIHRIVITGIM